MTVQAVAAYEAKYPWIPWREPVPVNGYYVCRVCLGLHGVKAEDLPTSEFCFVTYERWVNHFTTHHAPKGQG